jgi:hypothetical protein
MQLDLALWDGIACPNWVSGLGGQDAHPTRDQDAHPTRGQGALNHLFASFSTNDAICH